MNYQPGDVVRLKEPRKDLDASEKMTQYLHAMTGKTGVVHAVGLDGTSVVAVFDYELDALSRETKLTGCLLWTEEIEMVSRPAPGEQIVLNSGLDEFPHCPLCGGVAEPETHFTLHNTVRCTECGLETDIYDTVAEAIAAWNRRVDTDSGWDKVTDIVDPVHVVTDIDDCSTQGQCPSCHKADGICAVDFRGEYLVYCPKCNLRTISCASLADAIAVWDKVNKDES